MHALRQRPSDVRFRNDLCLAADGRLRRPPRHRQAVAGDQAHGALRPIDFLVADDGQRRAGKANFPHAVRLDGADRPRRRGRRPIGRMNVTSETSLQRRLGRDAIPAGLGRVQVEPAVVAMTQLKGLAVERRLVPGQCVVKQRQRLGLFPQQDDDVEVCSERCLFAGDGNAVRRPLDPRGFGRLRRDGLGAQRPDILLIHVGGDFDLDIRPFGLATKDFADEIGAQRGLRGRRCRANDYERE